MNQSSVLREAKILFASGQLARSIDVFNRAEEGGYSLQDVWLSRGAAQLALGNYGDAEKDFSRVLDKERDNERAFYYRGVARVGLARFEDAIEDLTQCLRRNNDRGIAHLARGLAYSELGDEKYAELDFNSASAFSEAELQSFTKLFGKMPSPFKNTQALLAKENAPWNNLLSDESAEMLCRLFK